jgi:hypothetical protein
MQPVTGRFHIGVNFDVRATTGEIRAGYLTQSAAALVKKPGKVAPRQYPKKGIEAFCNRGSALHPKRFEPALFGREQQFRRTSFDLHNSE